MNLLQYPIRDEYFRDGLTGHRDFGFAASKGMFHVRNVSFSCAVCS